MGRVATDQNSIRHCGTTQGSHPLSMSCSIAVAANACAGSRVARSRTRTQVSINISFIVKVFTTQLLISKDSIRGILPKTLKHLLIAQPQILRRLRQFNRLLQDDQHPLPRLQRHGVLGQEAFPIKFGSDDNHGLTIGEYTLDAGGACERANNSIVRIALFGGTFDPVHYGHLRLAEEAREAAGLERVLFVPAHMSPFRQQEPLSEPRHRLQMTRLAVADNPAFEASDIEIQRGGVSYTVDTVATLRAAVPRRRVVFDSGRGRAAGISELVPRGGDCARMHPAGRRAPPLRPAGGSGASARRDSRARAACADDPAGH
jgi:cytidyltransferase-like protein